MNHAISDYWVAFTGEEMEPFLKLEFYSSVEVFLTGCVHSVWGDRGADFHCLAIPGCTCAAPSLVSVPVSSRVAGKLGRSRARAAEGGKTCRKRVPKLAASLIIQHSSNLTKSVFSQLCPSV